MFKAFFLLQELISIQPKKVGEDLVNYKRNYEVAFRLKFAKAIVIRTLPIQKAKAFELFQYKSTLFKP